MMTRSACPLCLSQPCEFFTEDRRRSYFRCKTCDLVFVPPEHHCSISEEKSRYDLHDNTRSNTGYIVFLTTMADTIENLSLDTPAVLDFGSGKDSVLEKILGDRALICTSYDPLYGIGPGALDKRYDVVAASEVFEHLREPHKELGIIRSIINPGGYLLLRTSLLMDDTDFSSWWYKEDPTHICFYSGKTLSWIVAFLHAEIKSPVSGGIMTLQIN